MFAKKPKRNPSEARQKMYRWLAGPGRAFLEPRLGSTNYLGAYDASGNLVRQMDAMKAPPPDRGPDAKDTDRYQTDVDGNILLDKEGQRVAKLPPETIDDLRPFPLNRYFRSEAVLSAGLRDEIYDRITRQGQTMRQVGVGLKVSVERVAAVYRLKEVEKRWIEQGKKLHTSYSRTVMGMLPQTPYKPDAPVAPHESLNDLPVHPWTLKQLFHPTSESRQFTRVDAGRAFHPRLRAPEERIPHPEMVELHRDERAGFTASERRTRMSQRFDDLQAAQEAREAKARAAEVRHTRVVPGQRWDFRFRDANADAAGKDGRGRFGVGWRYGQPLMDRKKSQVRIPTQVE